MFGVILCGKYFGMNFCIKVYKNGMEKGKAEVGQYVLGDIGTFRGKAENRYD